MIHLYCLRCNHANDDDARFCSACGAGLIRVFCPQCHVTNGAESHFCQACGAALPVPPTLKLAPQASTAPVDAAIPDLTDVVTMPVPSVELPALSSPAMLPTATTALAAVDASPMVSTPGPQVEPWPAPRGRAQLLSPAQLGVLVLAIGAALALTASMMHWPGDMSGEPDRPADAMAPAVPMRSAGMPPAGTDVEHRAGLRTVAITPPGASGQASSVDAGDSPNARSASAAVAATGRVAAPPPTTVTVRPRPARAATPPPAAAHECTPEVHALGLCAAGATIIRRP